MLLEEQRLLHEDLERLEDAIAERLLDDPKHIRDRLARDHQIGQFLSYIENQSMRLKQLYDDPDEERECEVRDLGQGDIWASFAREIDNVKDFHRRYPNEPVENLEKAYKKRTPEEQAQAIGQIETMFTGEEGFGRFFDLTALHEQYLNLPGHQNSRRVTYLQYLDQFDAFTPPQCNIRPENKMQDPYFQYLKALQEYLEGFMRRTKPLENLDKIFANFDKEFHEAWEHDEVPGWEQGAAKTLVATQAAPEGEGIWCSACQRGFPKESVYEGHLSGKKHKRAIQEQENSEASNGRKPANSTPSIQRFKECAVAEREFRIKKLAAAMSTERSDTKVNVERKQGMTERERQQELESIFTDGQDVANGANAEEEDDSDGEDKIYNPLKLPLAWDGKPIPFWLYKLHGLGVEFPCEICGNFVYMGRRAFDKHFNEPRHVYGLKCLGITNTTLFREITGIEQALSLWNKIQKDKKKEKASSDNVVQMEDTEGNVMPEKIYRDLLAQGLL
ncbi:hypothetical protein BCR34DRAFT_552625 [Clohesyomyces aquaticus]|uniref:Matrin-type domain-containing protein n=1 Tax=Clohesyomyces aquaticus TaxID=1231657 RepID=A0A1Y2A9C8_9PLEO|nr:hypothetical protein BCR34DRAFT_552625 [Clohesyomyces aquaticus]